MTASVRGTVEGVARRAGVGFTAGALVSALGILWYASTVATVVDRRYVHMVVGLVWIGTNLLLALVLGPVVERMERDSRVDLYSQLLPKLAVFLPLLLVTTVGVGVPLALRMGLFPHAAPWLALTSFVLLPGLLVVYGWRFSAWRDPRWYVPFGAATLATLAAVALTADQFAMTTTSMELTLADGALITLVGLGFMLSGNLRACLELQRDDPDATLLERLGGQATTLARVQILLQLTIIISVL